MNDAFEGARAKAEDLGIGGYGRHVFICTGPDCCTPEQGQASWDRLKKRVGELNGRQEGPPVYRTKVGCLRICRDGPVGVVYPDGTWYAGLSPDVVDRLVEEHLARGEALGEHLIARNPLPSPAAGDAAG